MSNIFKLNENSNFEVNYKGKNYLISININEGLINLREIKDKELVDLQVMFIDDEFNNIVIGEEKENE